MRPSGLRIPTRRESSTDAACRGDCRCPCGSLLARLVPGGVEIKCRHCKRLLVLPLEGERPAGAERGMRA